MKKVLMIVIGLVLLTVLTAGKHHLISTLQTSAQSQTNAASPLGFDAVVPGDAERMMKEGKEIFRFDTFGDEDFWGDTLKLHQAIDGAPLGGVEPGVSPATALAVGLKVDVDALPASLIAAVKGGKVNFNDPATTLALLKLNSAVRVTGFFNQSGAGLIGPTRAETTTFRITSGKGVFHSQSAFAVDSASRHIR